jgi:hypothetical protein
MPTKKKKETEQDRIKYQIAKELGLSSKVDQGGWAELTSAETGRIGGIMSGRRRKKKKDEQEASMDTQQSPELRG